VRAALGRHGLSVSYVTLPWSRCLAEVRSGTIAAAIGTEEEEAPELEHAREPIGMSLTSFFTLATSRWRYRGLASLEGVRLGAVQGYSFGDALDAYIRANAGRGGVHLAAGDDALVRLIAMLGAGHLDAIVDDPQAVRETIRRTVGSGAAFRLAGTDPPPTPLLVGFTPGRRDLAARFDEGMAGLRASGELAGLLSRHGVPDWSPPAPRRAVARAVPGSERHR
jgi:polar amino acid transport system substrate-binding protein